MDHFILFTGHMIDAPGREVPRFPAYKEAEVRLHIQNELKHLYEQSEANNTSLKGIAGGACGGDILFHELCNEIKIPSVMYLALPREDYKKRSVSFANNDWEQRFDDLLDKLPCHVLPGANANDEQVWENTNEWMLGKALQNGGENMTLIALWDGKKGDGNGGTQHMIDIAAAQKAAIRIIDI